MNREVEDIELSPEQDVDVFAEFVTVLIPEAAALEPRAHARLDSSSVASRAIITMTMSYLTQEQVGQRIADLRAERGVSQRRLADVLGLDPSALSRIETGERGLAVGELVAVAEFLGVDTDALLLDEVDATPLFRNEGGPEQGDAAVAEFTSIIDEFFTFEAAARS